MTAATAVSEAGVAATPQGEQQELLAELQTYYDGKHGSLSKPENSKRIKEISAKLDALDSGA